MYACVCKFVFLWLRAARACVCVCVCGCACVCKCTVPTQARVTSSYIVSKRNVRHFVLCVTVYLVSFNTIITNFIICGLLIKPFVIYFRASTPFSFRASSPPSQCPTSSTCPPPHHHRRPRGRPSKASLMILLTLPTRPRPPAPRLRHQRYQAALRVAQLSP